MESDNQAHKQVLDFREGHRRYQNTRTEIQEGWQEDLHPKRGERSDAADASHKSCQDKDG